MRTLTFLSSIAILSILPLSEGAFAETVAQTAAKWGLLGTWLQNCSKSEREDSLASSYLVRDGKLFMEFYASDGKAIVRIVSATIKPDGAIELLLVYPSGSVVRQSVLIKASDGRLRETFLRNVDTDDVSVLNGKGTGTGAPVGYTSPWLIRCR